MPKVLFTDRRFSGLSTDAKVLYGLFLDRVTLSVKSGWTDECGRVYIVYTLEQVMEALGCADRKATKLMVELEKVGLIRRKKQGQGKPTLIYVKNFSSVLKPRFRTRENDDSGIELMTNQDSLKERPINTYLSETEVEKTDSSSFSAELSEMEMRAAYRSFFIQQWELEILKQEFPYEADMLDEILALVVDTVCAHRDYIVIARDKKPMEVVRGTFMKLDMDHIRFTLMCVRETKARITNMKQYLLATLYNAPLTISNYYTSRVRADMQERGALQCQEEQL